MRTLDQIIDDLAKAEAAEAQARTKVSVLIAELKEIYIKAKDALGR